MKVLITYDVETITSVGRKRLREVAKVCKNHGIRVQNSVFECVLCHADYIYLKNKLDHIIDNKLDSIRIYHLSENNADKVETLGKSNELNAQSTLIL